MQRAAERKVRAAKREYLAETAAGLDATQAAIRLKRSREQVENFAKETGVFKDGARIMVPGFGRGEASRASWTAKQTESIANEIFDLGSTDANTKMYLREKSVIDLLSFHGIQYIQRISDKEIIVSAGTPIITSGSLHAADNLSSKPDRINMTIDKAQEFVNQARLVLFQQDRDTIKFIAEAGYAVLNYDHKLVTAVPQKWRKKYDKYLEGVSP